MDKAKELILLGKAVKKLRMDKNLSQSELANIINKDRPSISRLEAGNVNPSYIFLLEVCEGLEIGIVDLLREF